MAEVDKMLTVADVCERLNVHEATVRRWIKAGTLPATRLAGTVWRIREADVERLIEAGQPHGDVETDVEARQ